MYQALYRKYRSQTFSQLVGQEVVAKTLKQKRSSRKRLNMLIFFRPVGLGRPVWLRFCQGYELSEP